MDDNQRAELALKYANVVATSKSRREREREEYHQAVLEKIGALESDDPDMYYFLYSWGIPKERILISIAEDKYFKMFEKAAKKLQIELDTKHAKEQKLLESIKKARTTWPPTKGDFRC